MAGGTIKGIILEFGGDTSGLQKALSKANTATSSLSKELRGVNSLLKLDPKNVELLEQKQTILNESIDATQDKLNQLKKIKEEADKKMAEGTKISEENYRNLQREIINTQNKLNGLTDELKQFNAQNSNWTKAGKKVQEYGNNITKVSEKVDEIGNKASVVSAGVVAGGTALVNSAMNLEDAVSKYVSSTNTAEEETEKYRQVLENINKNNYGEGYEDIADSMAQVKMQLKDINEQDLQNITEKAIALRDLFGYDVSESVRAVKAMMDNLNVSADEAFNLIAEGKKQGLDFSNELLDNINEYSVQFGKLGLSAEDMFNIFKSGAENGAFNLDKIGDAVKEFSIRAIDGSNTTIDGFKRIGLNADEMAKKFANGGETAKQAFIEVVNKLGGMDDKVSQSIAGVDLFGTMWEDLGPTVITSFSKMDNGISKSSDSMQKSIDQLYNTTKKKAETQLKRLQSLGADFGEEMLPVLEDLIDMAEGFIDKLEGMSDAEKENIVKIGLLVAGAGPLIKTMGTAGKVIGNVTNGIGIFSEAIGVATNKTTSSVKSVNNLAKVFGAITSPAGLATTAITLTAGALAYLAVKQMEAQQETKEFAEEMASSKTELEEYNASIDKTVNANLSEINSVSRLREELSTLVDENGKVKEGYETRVAFILNELNNALGTEYKLNGNIVQSYKELQNEIDGTIEKKKAEIVLNGQEEKYSNAIQKEAEAVENLKTAHDNLGMSLEDAQKKYDELIKKKEEYEKTGDVYNSDYLNTGTEIQNLENLMNAYKDAESTVKQYTEDKKEYEENYALFMQGKYNEISNTVKTKTQDWTNTSLETIRSSITEQQKALDNYKQIYETTGNEVALEQQKQAEENLTNLANQLVERTTTIGTLSAGEIAAWKALGDSSFEEYKTALSQMDPTLQAEIQSLTGIIANDETMTDSTKYKAEQMTSGFKDRLRLSGYTEEEIQNITNTLANDMAAETESGKLGRDMSTSLENSANGEQTGKNFLQGLLTGIRNGYIQKQIIDTANSLGDRVSSSAAKAKTSTSTLPGHKTGLDYVPYDNYIARLHKGERVLTAKENKQLMSIQKLSKTGGVNLKSLANSIANKNNFYFNMQINPKSLTEADMKRCFDFWEREAGKYF